MEALEMSGGMIKPSEFNKNKRKKYLLSKLSVGLPNFLLSNSSFLGDEWVCSLLRRHA